MYRIRITRTRRLNQIEEERETLARNRKGFWECRRNSELFVRPLVQDGNDGGRRRRRTSKSEAP
jgi:hypothetical protein